MTKSNSNSQPIKNALIALTVLLCSLTPVLFAQTGPSEEEIPQQAQQNAPPPGPGDPNLPPGGYDQSQTGPANGQYPGNQSPEEDPPGRVVRLQYTTGSVSIQPHGVDDWVEGSINRPLTTSDNIWADKSSRAELSLGSSVMRIGSETSLTLTNVSDNVVQMQLHQGALNVRVRRLFNGETYEIDTPNQAFTIRKAGEYRFDVDPNADSTSVTVWKGEGEATGQGSPVRVKGGEQARFTNGNSLTHQMSQVTSLDDFDQWARSRDGRQEHSESSRYVGPGTVGAEDLDQYGTWRNEPDYGPVWTPTVDPGWAPYREGRWVSVAPWGWTWVDDAPWGFAPFHYGRWNYFDGGWGWLPGPYYARPYYAPALVGWFGGPGWGWGFGGGFGFGVGFGFGFGGVGFGWCPLGWREPFFPWYGGSRGYFRNVNITNTRITNINRVTNNYYNHTGATASQNYANLNRPGGFTAVPKGTLMNSQPVAKNMAKVPADAVKSAPSLNQAGALSKGGATPTRASVLGGNTGRAAAAAPQGSMARATVSRLAPPANSMSHSPMSRGPMENAGARTPQSGTANRGEAPVSHSAGSEATTERSVARPPSSLGNQSAVNRGGAENGRNRSSENVSRPYSPGSTGSRSTPLRSGPAQMAMNRSVPRPPVGSMPRPAGTFGSNGRGFNSIPSNLGRGGYGNGVPRPSGPVRPAPRDYASSGNRGYSSQHSYGGYGNGGYGNNGSRGYGNYSHGGYGGPSYGGGYPGGHSTPSYGGASRGGYGGNHGSSSGGGYHGGGSNSGGGHTSGGGGGHSGGGGHGGGHR